MAADVGVIILVIFKVLKDATVAREMLLLFGDLVVLPVTDAAVTEAVLVDIEANIVLGLNISELIGRVIVVE